MSEQNFVSLNLKYSKNKFDHTQHNDSDLFGIFYKSILTTGSITDFETNLFSFMHEVLQQQTCLLYRNFNKDANADANKKNFVLQRGSYSNFRQSDNYSQKSSGNMIRKTFPTNIQLDGEEPPKSQKSKYWYEQQIDTALTEKFFSVTARPPQHSFISQFCELNDYIRCGMLLLDASQEIYSILLYEHPLYHSYLNTPLRLQQFHDFLSLALVHQQTVNYATLDQLTKTHRKYYFLNLVEQCLLSEKPIKKQQLLMIDIDFFKQFNDTHGHLEGDHCLQNVASAIKNSLRAHDIVGRFGGEEFICLIQSELQLIPTIAQRIHKTIKNITLKDSTGQNIPVPTVSIGAASLREGEPLNKLIARADKAMYWAKQNGRNQTKISS